MRLLSNWCAKAIDNLTIEGLETLFLTPLQSENFNGQLTSQSLVDRGDLFWSNAFLGYADDTAKYVAEQSAGSDAIGRYFGSAQEYFNALAVFFFLVDIVFLAKHEGENATIFPEFRLVQGCTQAVQGFVDRLKNDRGLLIAVAKLTGEDVTTFKKWPQRAQQINEAKLGGMRDLFRRDGDVIPTSLD